MIAAPIAKADLDFYLFVPPGHDELTLADAGLWVLHRENDTVACANIAARGHAYRYREPPEREERQAWYANGSGFWRRWWSERRMGGYCSYCA